MMKIRNTKNIKEGQWFEFVFEDIDTKKVLYEYFIITSFIAGT